MEAVKELLSGTDASKLARAKNYYGMREREIQFVNLNCDLSSKLQGQLVNQNVFFHDFVGVQLISSMYTKFLSIVNDWNISTLNQFLFVVSGRCSLHVAVLHEHEEMVDYLATNFRQTLRIGDNVRRSVFI